MIKMQGLIFDLDGTLIDSSGDIASALNVTLKQLGLPEKSLEEYNDDIVYKDDVEYFSAKFGF